mgnify:FL=1
MCAKHNLTDVYIEGWTKIQFNYSGINKNKIVSQSAIEMLGGTVNKQTTELDKFQNNKLIYPNKYHPNQQGHEVIAENLYNHITQ